MNFFKRFQKLKVKEQTDKKRILSITLISVGIACLLIGSSMAYLLFEASGTTQTISAGTLQLSYTNESEAIILNNAVPQSDEQGLNNNVYSITLTNTSTIKSYYELSLNNNCTVGNSYTVNGSSVTANVCIPNNYIKVAVKTNKDEDYTIKNGGNIILKGYLEAMLDGTIPPEMQEKYLGIVISETERLTKLTNNLLTINNVTDEGMILDISDFDIIATIKKTIETFQGTCEKKKIKFKLIFPDKELMVSADMSKIQQVLYNLIDNAIKFSNSDSSIIISVTEKGDKALISVKDFGIGIPRESISKIWERFYKTDVSRGKDKTGTGLGLSIVKEIITSHNEYIDVVSTEGVGTEFTFDLPKAKGHAPSVWG